MLKMLLVVMLVIPVKVESSKQQVRQSSHTQQSPKTDQRGTPESPLIVDSHAVFNDKEAAEEKRKEDKHEHTDSWIVRLTCAIALCSGIQCYVYWRQKDIMKSTLDKITVQADHMETQINDARASASSEAASTLQTLAILKRQADSLEKQNKAMRDGQRARLAMLEPKDPPDLSRIIEWDANEIECQLSVWVSFHNDGETKAFNVRAWGGMVVQTVEAPLQIIDRTAIRVPAVIREATLNNPQTLVVEQTITEAHAKLAQSFDEWGDALGFLIVYGELSYDDLYGDHHKTPFEYVWYVTKYQPSSGSNLWEDASYWLDKSPAST